MTTTAKRRHILMLEDDTEDRYITESVFKEKGYNIQIDFVTHGHEVMGFLDAHYEKNGACPDLVLLDKNVPTGSGMDVLRELKSHPVYSNIPVVMVSGTAFPKEVAESYRLGVNSYIQKPTGNKETFKKIESFINYWFDTVELPGDMKEELAIA
jgi:CheY-like chemotaxis protein